MLPNLGEGGCQNIDSLKVLYTKIGIHLFIYLVKEYLAIKLYIFRCLFKNVFKSLNYIQMVLDTVRKRVKANLTKPGAALQTPKVITE